MKKLFISTLLILFVSSTVFAEAFNTKQEEILWIPNPWVECNDNFSCGIKTAGFNFPLSLSNYTIRATKGIFEISYPLDDSRTVTVRKSFDEANNGDNSGDYTKYSKNLQKIPKDYDTYFNKTALQNPKSKNGTKGNIVFLLNKIHISP